MLTILDAAHVLLIGVGATALLDLWLLLLRAWGVPGTSFALIGRWVGHLPRGRFTHVAIAKSPPIGGEGALGWLTHYVAGIAFAALLVALQGLAWIHQPSAAPAIAVGLGTVVAPLFVMQPAMGAGFAASKTATPLKNCMRSVVNHAVFGGGLYLAAVLLAVVRR